MIYCFLISCTYLDGRHMAPTRHINNDKPGFGQRFINWCKVNDGTKGTFSEVAHQNFFTDLCFLEWDLESFSVFPSWLTDKVGINPSFLLCILATRCVLHTQGGSVSSFVMKWAVASQKPWWLSFMVPVICASLTGLFRLSGSAAWRGDEIKPVPCATMA